MWLTEGEMERHILDDSQEYVVACSGTALCGALVKNQHHGDSLPQCESCRSAWREKALKP
jgi:hypothetical protein